MEEKNKSLGGPFCFGVNVPYIESAIVYLYYSHAPHASSYISKEV